MKQHLMITRAMPEGGRGGPWAHVASKDSDSVRNATMASAFSRSRHSPCGSPPSSIPETLDPAEIVRILRPLLQKRADLIDAEKQSQPAGDRARDRDLPRVALDAQQR